MVIEMIVIISTKNMNLNQDDILLINSKVEIIDDTKLKYQDQLINYDYLLIEDMSLVSGLTSINILLDEGIPVTNWYGETTIDNIYYGPLPQTLDALMNKED